MGLWAKHDLGQAVGGNLATGDFPPVLPDFPCTMTLTGESPLI